MNFSKTKIMLSIIFLLNICLCVPMTVAAESTGPVPVTASDFIKGLQIVGDLKVRYDFQDSDKAGDEALERVRGRFRLGMKWNNAEENWKVAAGLCTGGLRANTPQATYSNEELFETGDIRLDYAYAEHTIGNFKFLAGQQKNPFATTFALWDSDVRPAGFTAGFNLNPAFITAGVYQARYINKDIARMEAVQVGGKTGFMTAAVAFYNYHRIDEYILNEDMDEDYTYQIVDFYASGKITLDPVVLTPYAQVFYNLGAEGEKGQSIQGGDLDPEEENIGYAIGVDAKIDRVKLGIAWAQIGADSVIQDLKDSNFGKLVGSTDVEGLKLKLNYALTRHCSLSGTAYLCEAKERDLDQDTRIYQIDLDYKF